MDGIHHITPYWRSGPEEKLSNEQLPTYVPSLAVRHHNDSCGLSSRGPVENVWSRFRKSFCFFSPMEHLGGFSLPEKKARFFHVTPINSDVSPQPTWLFVSVACPAFFEIWDGGLLQVVLRVFGYHLLDGDLGPGEHRNIGKPNGEMWWEIWSDVLSFSFVMIFFLGGRWGGDFWDFETPWIHERWPPICLILGLSSSENVWAAPCALVSDGPRCEELAFGHTKIERKFP